MSEKRFFVTPELHGNKLGIQSLPDLLQTQKTCDVTTSNSIQDGGALVVNILVFDLRVQLQHCTYQRKTLLFAVIKVSTFICKREISDFSSPLTKNRELKQSSCRMATAVNKQLNFRVKK